MGEYRKLRREIGKIKKQQARSRKISGARRELTELKYGKYLEPGRKVVGWAKNKVAAARSSNGGSSGGFDIGGGMEFGNPLEGIGMGGAGDMGGIQMGNPFGEPERRTGTKHHHKKQKVKIVYRTRPRRRRYYYR